MNIVSGLSKLRGIKLPSVKSLKSLRNKGEIFLDFINTIDTNSPKINRYGQIVAEGLSKGQEKFSNNKQIALFLKGFLKNADTRDLVEVFIFFAEAIYTGIYIYKELRGLNESEPIKAFQPLYNSMNISEDKLQSLFESYQFDKEEIEEIKDSKIAKVIDNDLNQFKFESGHTMEALNSNNLSDIKFSLRYHKNNTKNVNEFISSVSEFLKTAETTLTETDIKKLKAHYNRYA